MNNKAFLIILSIFTIIKSASLYSSGKYESRFYNSGRTTNNTNPAQQPKKNNDEEEQKSNEEEKDKKGEGQEKKNNRWPNPSDSKKKLEIPHNQRCREVLKRAYEDWRIVDQEELLKHVGDNLEKTYFIDKDVHHLLKTKCPASENLEHYTAGSSLNPSLAVECKFTCKEIIGTRIYNNLRRNIRNILYTIREVGQSDRIYNLYPIIK